MTTVTTGFILALGFVGVIALGCIAIGFIGHQIQKRRYTGLYK